MFVTRIDKVLGNDAACHLQARDIAVEAVTHLGLCKTTKAAQIARDEAAVLAQGQQYGFLDRACRRGGMGVTAPVVQVGPPCATHEARLLVEEFAIDAVALGNDGTFPVPQGPVPTAVIKQHIAAVRIHRLVSRETRDIAIQQGQESHLLDVSHQLGRIMY